MSQGPNSENKFSAPTDVKSVLNMFKKPTKIVVTAGMPYANGPLHLGHLAGAQIPADVYARWLRMLIGSENVLYVCGTDDHGSTSELAAMQAGKSIQDFINGIREKQTETIQRYNISMDIYTGTSHPDTFPTHKETAQD